MIKVNGEQHPWRQGLNVTKLLAEKNYVFHAIIVRINEKFIPPEEYDAALISDGDSVETIHLITGG
ncbi:sulfur carrier protein ThiS [candidate division TA06 bacterium]|uniref:Sulfur carrier protein ThiS n=1 Tax=candidate division TA06 bacterium TaxID=2250710 RepID=A0A933I887_UNCT6|nr:sulfur carrier protein ThiS [candidate division TA06 bacterium]